MDEAEYLFYFLFDMFGALEGCIVMLLPGSVFVATKGSSRLSEPAMLVALSKSIVVMIRKKTMGKEKENASLTARNKQCMQQPTIALFCFVCW